MTGPAESSEVGSEGKPAGAGDDAPGKAPAEAPSEAPAEVTIEVDALLPHPVDRVWRTLITGAGTEALLGPGAALGTKGQTWRSSDGPHGVLRSYHPMEQIRISWHADEDAPASLVDVHLQPDGDGTRVALKHHHVSPGESEGLHDRWSRAIEQVGSAAG